jgi:hypothetical protein
MTTIANSVVRHFFDLQGATFVSDIGGDSVFEYDDVIIVISKTRRIDVIHFMDIALDQMRISRYEVDYFLGENRIR